MRVSRLDGLQRMFRRTDQTDQNRTVGWLESCARSTWKRKKRI